MLQAWWDMHSPERLLKPSALHASRLQGDRQKFAPSELPQRL
jgi:hypothetical protein